MKTLIAIALILITARHAPAQSYKVFYANQYCFIKSTGEEDQLTRFVPCDKQLTFYKDRLSILLSRNSYFNYKFTKVLYTTPANSKEYSHVYKWEALDADGKFCIIRLWITPKRDNEAEVKIDYPGRKTQWNYLGQMISS